VDKKNILTLFIKKNIIRNRPKYPPIKWSIRLGYFRHSIPY